MASSAYGMLNLFQGMRYDSVTGLYQTPNRELNPATGTWLQADPAGYINGTNVYQIDGSNPATVVDPAGLDFGFASENGGMGTVAGGGGLLGDIWGGISGWAQSAWQAEAGGLQGFSNWALTGSVGDDQAAHDAALKAFDQSNFDRSNGVKDATVQRVTAIEHRYIPSITAVDQCDEDFTFDPANRANAAATGGAIIDLTALAVSSVSGARAISNLISAGGLAGLGGMVTGAIANGPTITALIINGRAVALTAQALVNAGITVSAANSLIGSIKAEVSSSGSGSSGPTKLRRNWAPRDITDVANSSGCGEAAEQIQKYVGGDIKTIFPKKPNPFLGPYRGSGWRWPYHKVVVSGGRVYDAFTGSQGEPIDVYKSKWLFNDAIDFGF
jgi:RHS repeat-associated protein